MTARKTSTRTRKTATKIVDAIVEAAAPEILTTDEIAAIEATPAWSEEIEAAVQAIEADEAASEPAAEPAAEEPSEDPVSPPSFADIRDAFSDAEVETQVFATAAALDERAEFEVDKNPDNENIQRTLKKVRSQLVTKRAARVMLAVGIAPDFVNRTTHEGSRYNVYALGKLADVIYGVTDGNISNAINLACMKSLFRFRAAGVPFTMELAKAAASDKIRVDAAVRQHLVRHTVSASTAPTQASSTMQALETLGVVKVMGSRKNPTYLVTDAPIVAHLEDKLLAA